MKNIIRLKCADIVLKNLICFVDVPEGRQNENPQRFISGFILSKGLSLVLFHSPIAKSARFQNSKLSLFFVSFWKVRNKTRCSFLYNCLVERVSRFWKSCDWLFKCASKFYNKFAILSFFDHHRINIWFAIQVVRFLAIKSIENMSSFHIV